MHRLARQLVGDEADDVVQQAFLLALQRPEHLTQPRSWLARVVRNLITDRRRRETRRLAREDAAAATTAVPCCATATGRSGCCAPTWTRCRSPRRRGCRDASTVHAEAEGGQAIGVMHACGHDVHMTVLLGTARWFAKHREQWQGTLVLIGQPAEERAGGARAMVAAGLFERFPKPAWALALHCDPSVPAGNVGVRSGPLMAAVDSVDVTLFGRGGHGARPHLTIDPVVLAAQYVLALQTIVSREIDPTQPAVITVGSIHAGQKHNIIADRCELQLTVRSYDPAVREHLKAAIVRKAKGLAESAGAPAPKVEFSEPTGPLLNDPGITAAARAALVEALGEAAVGSAEPQMVAEDFGYFREQGVPLCMFRLGTTGPEQQAQANASGELPAQLHTARFHPDAAPTIRGGVTALVAATRALLRR
ncbi:MAG: amidohydrolase [Planctomycetes bacterium]|nr:amidohydrolase [Planctomycetota bacterium]